MAALKVILGCVLIYIVLWDAFETIILPRRPRARFRLTRAFYGGTWRPWRALARTLGSTRARDSFLGYYGPLSLLVLLGLWAVGLVVAFGVLQWAAGSHLKGDMAPTFGADLYFSGSDFVTLGLGDESPISTAARFLAVLEAGMGLALLAMVISYLPVLYQSFSRRELRISLLDARAGTPPTAVELLQRHHGQMAELSRLLGQWEEWSADLLESHLSYPVLAYFRSQHDNQSWLAALVAVLDACVLCMIGIPEAPARQARLTFAIARHALVDLAQVFNTPPCGGAERLTAEGLQQVRSILRQSGIEVPEGPEADVRLAELRKMYEPYAHAISQYMLFDLPPWVHPKSADNWETSRWGRNAVV